jgi:hypothetical protein
VSRPQGIERERVRRRIGGSQRFLATQDVTRTPGEHGRPRCKGCLRPIRDGTSLAARPSSCTLTDAACREDVRATSRDFSGSLAERLHRRREREFIPGKPRATRFLRR